MAKFTLRKKRYRILFMTLVIVLQIVAALVVFATLWVVRIKDVLVCRVDCQQYGQRVEARVMISARDAPMLRKGSILYGNLSNGIKDGFKLKVLSMKPVPGGVSCFAVADTCGDSKAINSLLESQKTTGYQDMHLWIRERRAISILLNRSSVSERSPLKSILPTRRPADAK